MDAGYSLLNPGSSLNFDVPAVSVIQGKEEEDEAAEDEKKKEKELQAMMTNAFDDLIEDDEYNSSMFSANKSQDGSIHEQRSSNQMLKDWLHDNNWLQHKKSEGLSEPNRKLENTNEHDQKSFEESHVTNKSSQENHTVQNGKISVQNSLTSVADSVDNVSSYAAHGPQKDHYGNGQNWVASSQLQLEEGCYGAVGSEELTPSSDSRVSVSSYGCQSSPSNPDERQMNGHDDVGTAQFYKPLDDFEYSQYQVQYTGVGSEQQNQGWGKGNGNVECSESVDLQNQYITAGMDGTSAEIVQLQILYQARGREIEKLQDELEKNKDEHSNALKAVRHQLSRMKIDNEGLTVALKDCRRSLEESNQMCAQFQGNIAALETRTQSLEKHKDELINKLQVAESTIETLNHQVDELECSETLSRARAQHEMVVMSMQQRHELDTLTLKEKLDSLRNQVEEKTEEVNSSKQQVNKLSRMLENAQLDRADTINRLTKSLEESQRQCQDLLGTETIKETCQLHLRAQTAAASSVDSERRIQALQEEVTGLKEELEMLESACHLGLFPDQSIESDAAVQGTIRKKLEFKTPQFAGNKRLANGDLVSTLKLELERSLVCNKDKRNKLTKLQNERQAAVKELDDTKTKLADAEMQISTLKALNAELQAKASEPQRISSAHRRDADHLKKQRDHLTKELTTAHQHLAELEASEAKLTEANKRLSQQMAEMVKDCSEDRRQAVERCQQTYLQLHEESIRKIRQEMAEIHQNETIELKETIEKMAKELDSVKEMYVTVCQEKNEVEAHISKLQAVHEADIRERLRMTESNWQAKLKDLELEKEKAVKTAVNAVRAEKDSEWKLQLDNFRTEKEKEIVQKTLELTNEGKASKMEALKCLAEEKNLEREAEIRQLQEQWNKEKQGFMKTLQEKLDMERDELREQMMHDKEIQTQKLEECYEARMAELKEALKAEKEEELLQLVEEREKEKKQCVQQLSLKKNKEKWEKMRYLERLKDTEKQNELRELEVKKNEELRILEDLKNNEIADLKKVLKLKEKDCEEKLQRYKDKMKKDKQLLFNLLQESKSKTNFDELKAVNTQKEKEKREALEVLIQQKDEEKEKELRTLSELKDDEMMNALLQLANRKDREKESELKAVQENFNKQMQELHRQLMAKEAELLTIEKTLTEKLQLESHEILVKFAARKEQEKADALKELNLKRKNELEETLMSVTVNKDAEFKEVLKKLETKKEHEKESTIRKLMDEKDRQMKEFAKKYDSRMDASFFKILQDQNSELFKMLKAAREDFDKEKIALQQQHSKVVDSLKEENARLASSQADQNNKNQEQEAMAQQVTSLSSHITQLDAELVQHKSRVRELETSIILKVQELERLQQERNLEVEEYEKTNKDLNGRLQDVERLVEIKMEECERLRSKAEEHCTDIQRLQEKYEVLVHDLTNKFVEEKVKLQKDEDKLCSTISDLETQIQERDAALRNFEADREAELVDLQNQLQQALKDKESALNTQNALASETKSHQEALQEAVQQQAAMKEKLRRYHKYIQSREQQHQEIILKLQQEHGVSLRELTLQLEELKKATEASAEERVEEMASEHKNFIAKLEVQHKVELDKLVREIGELQNKLQQYESAYKQLQRDSSAENIAEIQDNIKQVVHVLQRDIFQYVDGLNQRVAQRIQTEVLKERNNIIASLREQFGIQVPREKMTVAATNSSAKHIVRSVSSNNNKVANEKVKAAEEKHASRKASHETAHTDGGGHHHHHHHHHHQTVPKHSEAMTENLLALLPTLRELGKRIPELLGAGFEDDRDYLKSSPATFLSKTCEGSEKHLRTGVTDERSSGFESANTSSSYPSNVKGSGHSSQYRTSHGNDANHRKDDHRQLTDPPEAALINSMQYRTATSTSTENLTSVSKPPVTTQKQSPGHKPTHRKVRRIANTLSQTSVGSQASLPLQNSKPVEKTSSANALSIAREQPVGQSASDTGYVGKDKLSVSGMIQSTLNNLLTTVTGSLHTPDDNLRNKNHLNVMDKSVFLRKSTNKLQDNSYYVPGTEESIQFVFGSNSSLLGNLAQPREFNPLPDHLGQATTSKTSAPSDNGNKTFLPLLTESDISLGDEYRQPLGEQKGATTSTPVLSQNQRESNSTQSEMWGQFPSVVSGGK